LAEAAEAAGLTITPPRIVVSDSETLLPNARQIIRRVLGTDPVDVYGLVEVSNFAWECDQRRGFHVSADSHIVEVDAEPGKAGAMIVTALGMWTMPFIRYETGDIADMALRNCPCGRSLPLLGHIRGREWDVVALPDGRRLYGPFFHEIFAGYPELHQWQIVQRELNRLEVKLDIRGEAAGLQDRVRDDLRRVLPPDVRLHIRRVNGIRSPGGKKFKVIDSRV
jgi:phenylacetate-CoA ligase